jgi:hypothetical protein
VAWRCVNPNCLKPLRTNIDPLDDSLSDPANWD